MYKNKRILAVIPARGGSKGLPRKNIKDLNGKPLIAWTIEQASHCKLIDEIFVSTDCPEIAKISEQWGIIVPSLRPAHLASDTASSIDVLLFTIDLLEKAGKRFDLIALLEPTSPLRDSEDIDAAITMLVETKNAGSVMSVCRAEASHPDFLTRITEDQFLRPFGREKFVFKRRQEIERLYFFEGSLYISYVDALKKEKSFCHQKTLGYEVAKYKSFEVDDAIDFKIVEALLKTKQSGELI
ncbi:MAG TPA: acylneuraminate cytidylyltransferase family protein [Candidatus Omnitrophota bacterium]|nr:acylneuraminate cytidylyltransferase family protein [Candidatus Omnitrophota bacterium]